MSVTSKRGSLILAGALCGYGILALAEDTELFVTDASQFQGTIQSNVLFILDTSGSMDTELISQATYDPAVTYAGDCDDDRVYWRRITGPSGDPPDCDTNRWFNADQLMCDAAVQAFASNAGRYTDLMAQYDMAFDERYERLRESAKDRLVECEDDGGVHGDGSNGTELWASDDMPGEPWSADPSDEVPWGSNLTNRTYTVYDANYLNWYYGPTSTTTRLQVMKDVSTSLLTSLNGVNVGLMRFNREEGGPVIYAMEDIAAAGVRQGMIDAVNGLPASGWTPLAESMYEAGQYYAGRSVDYGDPGNGAKYGSVRSVDGSRVTPTSSVYDSPIEYACQKSYIVMLTDGEPTRDQNADNKIRALPQFDTLVGNNCNGNGDGKCMDEMAEYLFKMDLVPDPALLGQQNVTTYTIGFTVDLPILASTATRGGGAYYTATDTASLTSALTTIITEILDVKTTFTAPGVAVNSFNRTRTLNDMYISLFEPSEDLHWVGNLKKYRLRAADGVIVDANGNGAVDAATGFFADSAHSYWSAIPDGAEVGLGGAANQIPGSAARNVYTYLGSSVLSAAVNSVDSTNLLIDDALLGIGAPGDPTRSDLIDFMRGLDVTDIDQDDIFNEPRYQMGDPLHARPKSVVYGGTVASPDINDAVIYFATNDGYLHAVDAATGVEKWSFIPPEFLGDQVDLFFNDSSPDKHYGIDGSLTVQVLENGNGVVEPAAGDKVYLYFGMRRGGTIYYGLDVTNPDTPTLMWTLDGASLPGVGQSWSTPMPTRIDIQGAGQNAEQMVLIFGGGYDVSQDNAGGSTDTKGNAIYIVDSVSGALLWHASENGANRNLAQMQYSIPSDVRVIDLDTDNYADRIYAADMGGQVWRLDIFNGQPVASLITGGVIAQLGGAPVAAPPVTATRRFYYAPDLALVNNEENNFLHIGIGSGHRAHPNSQVNEDRFYALRDYDVFSTRTQADYDTAAPTTDADLVDITDNINAVVPVGSPGWRFELRDGGWIGEKVLAEARTFDNQVYITTFTPGGTPSVTDCQPKLGTNRLYILDIFNGGPAKNLDGVGDETNLTENDRYIEFEGSIASEVVFLFPSPDDPDNCVGDECVPPPVACVDLFCFQAGFANNPRMTFWSQESAQ